MISLDRKPQSYQTMKEGGDADRQAGKGKGDDGRLMEKCRWADGQPTGEGRSVGRSLFHLALFLPSSFMTELIFQRRSLGVAVT